MPVFGKKEESSKASPSVATSSSAVPAKVDFSFSTQLAHGSPTKKISNFSNVKEMYQAIGSAFDVKPTDVVFCTLNTPKIDMNRLLGGQIVFDDFIFAHIRADSKTVSVEKVSSTLGLSITDNGAGLAFIKRIYPDSLLSKLPNVFVGDLIEEVNGQSMINKRHSDVATALKEVPVGSSFTLKLGNIKRAEATTSASAAVAAAAAAPDVKAPPPATAEEKKTATDNAGVAKALGDKKVTEADISTKVEDLLESFMGIRDSDLAEAMIGLAEGLEKKEQFLDLVQENFGEFEFPEEFSLDVWDVIHGGEAALFM